MDDATVEAVGALTEALETAERARGRLFDFHQLSGSADAKACRAAAMLRDAGHTALAEELERDLIGRNVVPGRWTFQLVEDYDDGYHRAFRDWERRVRDELLGGVRHVFEAELKERNTTAGAPGQRLEPSD